jgi:hypothetical protein
LKVKQTSCLLTAAFFRSLWLFSSPHFKAEEKQQEGKRNDVSCFICWQKRLALRSEHKKEKHLEGIKVSKTNPSVVS